MCQNKCSNIHHKISRVDAFFPDIEAVFKKSNESSLHRPQHHFFPAFLRQSQLGNLRFTLTCAKASSHRNEDDIIKLERPPCLSPFPISKEKSNAAASDLQLIKFLYRQPHRWGLQLWFEMSKSSHPPPTPSLPQPTPPTGPMSAQVGGHQWWRPQLLFHTADCHSNLASLGLERLKRFSQMKSFSPEWLNQVLPL